MLIALVICLTVLILAERFRPFVDRLVAIKERAGVPMFGPSSMPKLPDDLEAMVGRCTTDWERDDLIASLQQHYVEARALTKTDDEAWVAVRARIA